MLRKVHLHGRLAKKFGAVFELDVNSPAEAIRALAFQLPGFRKYISGRKYAVTAGDAVLDEEALKLNLGRQTDIHIIPAGAAAGIETILLGVTLLLAAVSAVMVLAMPKAVAPGDREQDKRNSYIFDGAQNNDEQGHVVPVVYGTMRVGSVVASAGISTTDVTESAYAANPVTGEGSFNGGAEYAGFAGASPNAFNQWVELFKGGKAGAGSSRSAQEDPNSLQSQATAKIVDVVSEGEIVGLVDGLKSVYFDDTPLQNPDGSFNFAGVAVDQRFGLPDQDFMPGFSQTENTIVVDTDVRQDLGPVTRNISDPDATIARVTIRLPQLYAQDTTNGDMKASSVAVKISVQVDGGGFTDVVANATFEGKTTSGYQRSYDIRLPPGTTRQVRVTRLTADSTLSSLQNATHWDLLTEIVEAKLSYPDTALFGLTVDARQFGTNIPTRSYLIKGLIVEVPTNYDPIARTYTGAWDGTFKRAWTDNPAWVYRDMIINRRYGLGERVAPVQVDKWVLYAISQYNDELVPDMFGGTEPRYRINCCINTSAQAYDVLASIASTFRGFAYWGSAGVTAVQDSPEDPSLLITPSNVIDGTIDYGRATPLTKRRSVGVVYWNDPDDNYRLVPMIYEDPELIRRFGYRTGDPVTAFGCTSPGQAHRMARWLLEDESQSSNTTATYQVGDDHGLAEPGRVATIADPMYAGVRRGGRAKDATADSVTLDQAFMFAAGQSYAFRVMLPDGTVSTRPITNAPGSSAVVALGGASFTTTPLKGAVWTIESDAVANRQFRLRTISLDDPPYQVQALIHDPTKYDRVERDLNIAPPNYIGLPTGPLEVPAGLAPFEFLSGEGTAAVPCVNFSWKAPTDPRIATAQAQYKRPGANWEPFADGLETFRVIRNAEPGEWLFRVRFVDLLGRKTQWVQTSEVLDGQQDTIPDPATLTAVRNDAALTSVLRWTYPIDFRPITFEVRWNSVNDYASSSLVAVTDAREVLVSRTGYFFVTAKFINAESNHVVKSVAVSDLPNAIQNQVVFAYKRSATVPSGPSATVTYDFTALTLTGLNNGWTQAIPAPDGNPLYAIAATASSSTSTDTIASGEWTSPVIQYRDGTAGAPGGNSAPVLLFQRNNTGTAPAVPSVTTTYTFASGVLAGVNNGWSTTAPDPSAGKYLFMTSATAFANTATDTIASGEWAVVKQIVQDGSNGIDGTLSWTPVLNNTARSGSTFTRTSGTSWAPGTTGFITSPLVKSADKFSFARMAALVPDATSSTMVGLADGANVFALYRYQTTGTLILWQQIGTLQQPVLDTGIALTASQLLELVHVGTSIKAYVDGVEVGQFTHPSIIPSSAYYLWLNSAASGVVFQNVAFARAGAPGAAGYSLLPGANVSTSPNSVTKTAGGSAWNAGARSREAYLGDCQVTATVASLGFDLQIGLNSDAPTDGDGDTIDFAIYQIGSNNICGRSAAGNTAAIGTAHVGDVVMVRRRGSNIEFSVNGGTPTILTGVTSPSTPLYLDSTLFQVGASWSNITFGPVGSDGSAGLPGMNSATVKLYQRAASAPSVPSTTTTYTFATAAATGFNNGWSTSVPANDGNPLWVTAAPAVSASPTDTIASGEWASPQIEASNGAAGSTGLNSATILLLQRNNTGAAPAAPSVTTTYTFSSGSLAGVNNGWSQVAPDPSAGKYLFMTTAAALGAGSTDTIASGEWAVVKQIVKDGDNGQDGLIVAPASQTFAVNCTSNGTPKTGEFNKTVTLSVMSGTTDLTTDANTTYAATFSGSGWNGSLTANVLTLTGITVDQGADLAVQVKRFGVTVATVHILGGKNKDGATAVHGNTALTTMPNSTTFVQVGSNIDLSVPDGGTMTVNAVANWQPATGSYGGQIQVSIENLTDAGAPSYSAAVSGDIVAIPGEPATASINGFTMSNTSGATKTFRARFYGRRTSGSGTASMTGSSMEASA